MGRKKGFYIQEDFWLAVADESAAVQNAVMGALARLYFEGKDSSDSLPKTAKGLFIALRDRVKCSRSRSNPENKRTNKTEINVEIKDEYMQHTEVHQKDTDLLKRESEREISTCKSKGVDTLPTTEEVTSSAGDSEPWVEFVGESLSRFEAITGRSCRIPSSSVTLSLRKIFDAGYSIRDIEAVCESKSAEWGDDCKMSRYLRPETIFGDKFEGYLSAAKADPGKAVRDAAVEYADAF